MADVRVKGPAVGRDEGILTPVSRVVVEQVDGIGELDRLEDARRLFEQVAPADEFPDLLTLPACGLID
jgi:malate synthase